MQIQEIVIENFGKLSNKYYKLHQGWQVFYGKNEAGKTTLKNFLIGILYGFKYVSKSYQLNRGDGGCLVVSHQGKLYKVERFYQIRSGKIKVTGFEGEIEDEENFLFQELLGGITYKQYKQIYHFDVYQSIQERDIAVENWQELALSYAVMGQTKLAKLTQEYQRDLKQLYAPRNKFGIINNLIDKLEQIDEQLKQLDNQEILPKKDNYRKQIIELQAKKELLLSQEQVLGNDEQENIKSLIGEWEKRNLKFKYLEDVKKYLKVNQALKNNYFKFLFFLLGMVLLIINPLIGVLFLLILFFYFAYLGVFSLLIQKYQLTKKLKIIFKTSKISTKDIIKYIQLGTQNEERIEQIKQQLKIKKIPSDTLEIAKIAFDKLKDMDFSNDNIQDIEQKLSYLIVEERKMEAKRLEFKTKFPYSKESLLQQRQYLYTELDDCTKEYQILKLKLNWLQDLKEQQRLDKLPKILKKASNYFYELTQQKYQQIILKENKLVLLTITGVEYQSEELSTATKSQLILSLRLAFIEEWQIELPLIIDDGWQSYDESRKQALYNILNHLPMQIITMTSDEQIKEYVHILEV